MALKNVKRITFSLPTASILTLEMNVEKNKRSKAIAQLIDEKYSKKEKTSFQAYCKYWDELVSRVPRKSKKTAVELIREDRNSH